MAQKHCRKFQSPEQGARTLQTTDRQTDRRQTDRRTDDDKIANVNMSSRSLKMSVLWPSKYAKIRFRPGLYPAPAGELTTLPQTPQSAGEGTRPSPYPTPTGHGPTFGARHASPPRSPARSTLMAARHSPMLGYLAAIWPYATCH